MSNLNNNYYAFDDIMNMKNIFFVDSENVGDSWIELFDYLNDEDMILVFYTDKSPNMSYKNLITLKQSPFFPEFIMCENGTENSLDFQLVSCLGSYTVKNPEDNLIIVSKDKGFDSVVHFWSERGYNICRKAPSIFYTLSNEPVTEVHASTDPLYDSLSVADATEITEITDENDNPPISDPISQIEFDKEQVDILLSCIGKSNLSAIHNILISIYGQTVGSSIYGKVKNSSYVIPSVNWQKKTKYKKFLNIVYHNSGIILSDDFYKSLYPMKANLQKIYKLYIEKFGQAKGAEYYRIYKPYAEFLQTTF